MAIEIETTKTRFKGKGFNAIVVVETNEGIEGSPRVFPALPGISVEWTMLDVKAMRDLLTEILVWAGES